MATPQMRRASIVTMITLNRRLADQIIKPHLSLPTCGPDMQPNQNQANLGRPRQGRGYKRDARVDCTRSSFEISRSATLGGAR